MIVVTTPPHSASNFHFTNGDVRVRASLEGTRDVDPDTGPRLDLLLGAVSQRVPGAIVVLNEYVTRGSDTGGDFPAGRTNVTTTRKLVVGGSTVEVELIFDLRVEVDEPILAHLGDEILSGVSRTMMNVLRPHTPSSPPRDVADYLGRIFGGSRGSVEVLLFGPDDELHP